MAFQPIWELSTVLISGESGTGKELFAQAIHNASSRRGNPFVAVNCAAFPEPLLESELFGYEDGAFTGSRKGGKAGLFETAHTGTVFLDEIGDMPLVLQTRLLRVLQEKEIVRLGSSQPIPVDVRVIAATHQPLLDLVNGARFRGDLYYRLNILQLRLPALRERPDDVPLLASQLLTAALKRIGSTVPADKALAPLMPLLCAYQWPGNVRELENIAERLAVHLAASPLLDDRMFQDIGVDFPELFGAANVRAAPQAPVELRSDAALRPDAAAGATDDVGGGMDAGWGQTPPLIPALRTKRRAAHTDDDVRRALHECSGNRMDAAVLLGMSRTTLWRRLGDMERSPRSDARHVPPAGL